MKSTRMFLHFGPPLMILCPLLWMMAGCLYVPWFEHRTDQGPNMRDLLEPSDANRVIHPGQVTRSQIHATLGPPPYVTDDLSSEAYVAHTGYGYWVTPLCFVAKAEAADEKVYAVRLDYDANGRLKSFERADAFNPFFSGLPAEQQAIEKVNQVGPKLSKVVP